MSPARRISESPEKAISRSASGSIAANVGLRASLPMSSSNPMLALSPAANHTGRTRLCRTNLAGPSRDQLIATRHGHEKLRLGWISFDLLAQPVNMRLERVRRDICIVAPDFAQQHFPRGDRLSGAIEEPQDRRFLFGQAELIALFADQMFGARLERIGPDPEQRLLVRLMLAQMGADSREEFGEAKWFCH